ncbi:hypothetical protein VTI74DRAFT_8159 [Chaetomium olivicolor]
MGIPTHSVPPDARTSCIIDQLEGERLTIPGSKGVFRILASSKQTNGGIAVFSSGAVLSDAPGFHWHAEAHDVFLKVIHNPELLGPHTETLGLVAPGDWVDFFRYVAETYSGLIVPETDDSDLRSLLIPKVMAAKDRFDVHFERDYKPLEVGDWLETENVLPGPLEPYFLRANTGPRWMLGGVMSRPFINASQCSGKFAISSIESSSMYPSEASPFKRCLTFPAVDHCFSVMEGVLKVRLKGEEGWTEGWTDVREGQTLVISAGQAFMLEFATRYVRAIIFTNGPGIELLIHAAGRPYQNFVLPDHAGPHDEEKLRAVCAELGVQRDS